MKGIDVSVHNGIIDWQAIKEAGYKFAIIGFVVDEYNRHVTVS